MPDNPPLTIATCSIESSDTSNDVVDQHENLDQNWYEDIMISVGLDAGVPQQALANTFPCEPFIALIGCTRIGRSVSPLSSEEGDGPLPEGNLLVLQFVPVVAENGTTT